MPRWLGWAMAGFGALLALAALTVAAIAATEGLDVNRTLLLVIAVAGGVLFVVGLVYSAIRQLRVRRVLPPERYRGPSVFLLLALAFVLAIAVNLPFSEDAANLLGGGELTLLGAIVILVSTQVALLIVSWLFVYRPNALAALPRFPGPDAGRALLTGLGWGVVAWLASSTVIVIAAYVLDQLGIPPEPQTAEIAIEVLDPWLVIIAVVIIAPIAEEAFFRGVVFNAWLREAGRRWAFFGSAALFAAIHLSLLSLLPIFVLGLGLAWIYDRTKSLLAPIAMHATVNGISVALALLVRFDVLRLPV
jgi:membrane protease YdiL (CAAX protease family)